MSEEFTQELKDLVKRHSADLDADDLFVAADRLERQAEQWRSMDDVW